MDKWIKDASYSINSVSDNYNLFGIRNLYSLINPASDEK